MKEQFNLILSLINLNTGFSETDKESLLSAIKEVEKAYVLVDFKFGRIEKERRAISVLLEETIDELQQKSLVIEEANLALTKTLNELKGTQEQLVMSEKMASLGQLTAGIAHEINNPINFVSANIKPLREDLADIIKCLNYYQKTVAEKKLENEFSEVLKFSEQVDIDIALSEVDELLNGIEDGASRTTEIVKGLRNFSRLDQNVIKQANLNEGLESTLTLLHSNYKDRIEIVKDYGDIPEVDCFPGQINQVFMNLLSNAVQAIQGEGKIFIKTIQENNKVVISIKDTGGGIPDKIVKNIFDPFFTTKEVGQGTGLGLSISYSIIEKHKGKLEVFSEKDKGATFVISLPLVQEQENN